MKFKSKQERLAHPIAGLIPKNLWDYLYAHEPYDVKKFKFTIIDFLSRNYATTPLAEKKRVWLLILLCNQKSLNTLKDFAKNKLQLTDFDILFIASSIGRLDIINIFHGLEIKPYLWLVFKLAARNNHLKILNYLIELMPEHLSEMVSTGNFFAFREAARNGHFEVFNYIISLAPEQLLQMMSSYDFYAFREAARNGYINILDRLVSLNLEQTAQMISAGDFFAFRGAASNGHLNILKYIASIAPNQLPQMITAKNCDAFNMALAGEHITTVNYLLSFPLIYSQVEKHFFQKSNFSLLIIQHTCQFLHDLQEEMNNFKIIYPNGVFDLIGMDILVNEEKRLYGYYVLRQLLRQLPVNSYGDEVYTYIYFLLNIPTIKRLVIWNATEINFPALHRYSNTPFAEKSNELLHLAVINHNYQFTQRLLAIPVIYEAAQNKQFQDNLGADAIHLVLNPKLSIIGLTPVEQVQIEALELIYQKNIAAYPQNIEGIIYQLRAFLEKAFTADEHLALRQITLRNVIYTLPFDYSLLHTFITTSDFNNIELQQIHAVYYKNDYHTAWRYLAKPNFWMHSNASYVYVNQTHAARWSTFEEHQSLIAYLWLAAGDSNYPPVEKNVTVNHRINLYIQQLALINRAHNWNKSRVRLTKEGKPMMDCHSNLVTEEYDDLEGDKPSCSSEVKQRLLQALLHHPLYKPIDDSCTRQKQQQVTELTSYTEDSLPAKIKLF